MSDIHPRTTRLGPFLLGSSFETPAFFLASGARLSIQCIIDNGTDGQPPTDQPLGGWRLYCSGIDDVPYARIAGAETGDFSLAGIAPAGDDALVTAFANFEAVPGARAKLSYVRTSGGETARCRLWITTR